tara:strand:- start:663 stop:764 length:102 start_codon:yes stop_codon:yes gene_type:complete
MATELISFFLLGIAALLINAVPLSEPSNTNLLE